MRERREEIPKTTLAEVVSELEKQMIKGALERSSGNIARAANDLGLSRKGLYVKIDRLNFQRLNVWLPSGDGFEEALVGVNRLVPILPRHSERITANVTDGGYF